MISKIFLPVLCYLVPGMLYAQQQEMPSTEHHKNMKDSLAITQTLDKYFKSIYEGDVVALSSCFHSGTLLFGDVKGQPYAKTLEEYLDGVKNRQSPKDSGQPFKGEIVSVDIVQSIGIAKVRVKMYAFHYYEFLSFHLFDGQWLIVNKMISDVNE